MEKFNKRRFILKGSLTIEGYFEVYGNDKINLYNEYYKKLNENRSVEVPEEIAYNVTMKCYIISSIILCISLIVIAVCVYSLIVK